MNKKQRAELSIKALIELYPDAACSLTYKKPYELLMATRLSAQCTDKRVNIVTDVLFSRFTSLEQIAAADISEIEEIIKSCGLYKTKARDLKNMANELIERYNGVVPDTIEELITLSGIGRKTANLIVGDVYHKPSVVVDTHCIRITNRIGLTKEKDPTKIELELKKLLPPEESGDFCHRIVHHGRALCTARNPKCSECILNEFCKEGSKSIKRHKKIV